jgi:hypothetical protein
MRRPGAMSRQRPNYTSDARLARLRWMNLNRKLYNGGVSLLLIRRILFSALALGAFAMAVAQYRVEGHAADSALLGIIGVVLVFAAIAGKG